MNGSPAQIGDQLTGSERIAFDGKAVKLTNRPGPAEHSHIAYYKPAGELTTRVDEQGRRTVFASLPRARHGRWISVGRLDVGTSGLLILTTDGELAHRLMHPSFEVARQYAVRILGTLDDAQIASLSNGVELDDGPARFDKIRATGGDGANRWYHVSLREGRNREVRRMFEAVGVVVSRLIRTRYGPVELGKLSRGKWRALTPHEVWALYDAVDLKPTVSQ